MTQHDEAKIGMDQEHDGEQVDRRDRRIEHRQQHRPGEERAEVLQVGQRLELAARAVLRRLWRRRSGPAPPNLASASTAMRIRMKRRIMSISTCATIATDHDERQHHQRIGAAAGQHAIGDVEQVDRYRQHQHVDDEREDPDRHHVAAGARKTLAEHVAEFIVAGTLVQRRLAAASTSPSASTAGGTSAVLVASTFERGRRSCLLDHDGGSRRRGLCLLSHRWLDGRRLRYSGCRWSSFLIRELEGRILRVRRRRIKPWTKRNDLGRIRRPVAGLIRVRTRDAA